MGSYKILFKEIHSYEGYIEASTSIEAATKFIAEVCEGRETPTLTEVEEFKVYDEEEESIGLPDRIPVI